MGAYGKARTDFTQERAQLVRMQRQRLQGELISANEVRAGWSAIFARVKARMLAIPSKCAPRLVGLKTAAEAKAIVEPEVYEALQDASNIEIRVIGRGRETT
jgi:phage terminase Nu1 subunit (DNA packaging protein)